MGPSCASARASLPRSDRYTIDSQADTACHALLAQLNAENTAVHAKRAAEWAFWLRIPFRFATHSPNKPPHDSRSSHKLAFLSLLHHASHSTSTSRRSFLAIHSLHILVPRPIATSSHGGHCNVSSFLTHIRGPSVSPFHLPRPPYTMPPIRRHLVESTPSDDGEHSEFVDELDDDSDGDFQFLGSTPATNNSSRAPSLDPNPGNAAAGPPRAARRHFFELPENFRPVAARPPTRIPDAPPLPVGVPVPARAFPAGVRRDANAPGSSAHNAISLDSSDEEDAPHAPAQAGRATGAGGPRRVMSPREFRDHMDGESADRLLDSRY